MNLKQAEKRREILGKRKTKEKCIRMEKFRVVRAFNRLSKRENLIFAEDFALSYANRALSSALGNGKFIW